MRKILIALAVFALGGVVTAQFWTPTSQYNLGYPNCAGGSLFEQTWIIPNTVQAGGHVDICTWVSNYGGVPLKLSIRQNIRGPSGVLLWANPDSTGRLYLPPGGSDIVRGTFGLVCAPGGNQLGVYEVTIGFAPEDQATPCSYDGDPSHVYDERNVFTVTGGSICQGY